MPYGPTLALVLLATSIGTLASLHHIRGALGKLDKRVWWTMVGIVALHVLLTITLVPFDIWHSNRRGLSLLTAVESNLMISQGGIFDLHGAGTSVALILSRRLTGETVSIFGLQAFWSWLATAAAFAWVTVSTRDAWRGVVAAAVLVALPLRLRLGPTDCMYVVPEATWLLGLTCLASWARTRQDVLLILGASWLTFTAHCRIEFLIFAPLSVPVALATQPDAWRALVRKPLAWACLAGAALSYLPRVQQLLSESSDGGIATMKSQDAELVQWFDVLVSQPEIYPLYGLVGLTLAGAARSWAFGTPEPRWRPIPKLPAVGATLAVVLASLWPGLAPDAYSGHGMQLTGALSKYADAHALTDPAITPLGLILLASLGAAWLAWQGEHVHRAILVVVVIAMWVYLPRWDNESTFVRVGLSLAWAFAYWASAATVVLIRACTPQLLGQMTLGLGLTLLALPRYAGWISYRYPMQLEYELLERIRDLRGKHHAVHILRQQELPASWQAVTSKVEPRYAPEDFLMLGQPDFVRGLTDEVSPGDLYLRGIDCLTPWMQDAGPRSGAPAWWYGIEDRLYLGTQPTFQADHSIGALLGTTPRVDVSAHVPCWSQPEQAVCSDSAADETCRIWRCAEDAQPDRSAPYLDHVCATFESQWVLEPILEYPVPPGRISGTFLSPLGRGIPLGLYRIVTSRAPQTPLETSAEAKRNTPGEPPPPPLHSSDPGAP